MRWIPGLVVCLSFVAAAPATIAQPLAPGALCPDGAPALIPAQSSGADLGLDALDELTAELVRRLESYDREISTLRQVLNLCGGEVTGLRELRAALQDELAEAEEQSVTLQGTIDQQGLRIAALSDALAVSEETLAAEQLEAAGEIDNLNVEVVGLRDRIRELQDALSASEATVTERDLEIANLSARLNQALLRQVEEMGRYRSEFFGRMRAVLGQRSDIRIVGDRFVFQSEVLFPSGSARLQQSGADELAGFADTLLDLAAEFPDEVDWILRVDGHTDERPISTPTFRSNWELSTARALEVVAYLETRGVPSERLAAAGFGEFQPLDASGTEEAYQRNRRIELKLDQR